MNNGLQTRWLRSSEGHLARTVVHRLEAKGAKSETGLLSFLLGINSAHAQESNAPNAQSAATTTNPTQAPGALTAPTKPQALIDQRYLWDERGNLLYGTGDLSDVALNWMVKQATDSGITMKAWNDIGHDEWGVVTDPVVHGKGADLLNSDFCLRANNEMWVTNCVLRKDSNPGGLTTAEIARRELIIARSTPGKDTDGTPIIGDVDMVKYADWLKKYYGLTLQ